jgi:hypothetical protein
MLASGRPDASDGGRRNICVWDPTHHNQSIYLIRSYPHSLCCVHVGAPRDEGATKLVGVRPGAGSLLPCLPAAWSHEPEATELVGSRALPWSATPRGLPRRDGGALGGGHGRRGRAQELTDAAASRPRARPARSFQAARGAGAHRRHGLPTAGCGGAPTAAADARGGARPRPSRTRGRSSGERSCPSAGKEELPTARPVPLLHCFSSIQNCSLSLPQPGRCMFACCKLII